LNILGCIEGAIASVFLSACYPAKHGVICRDALLDQVLYEAPDVIGFQEVTPNQLVDINNVLSGEYSYVSNARDDGNQLGEVSLVCPALVSSWPPTA
jgi:hypothetical protein